jgi:Ca-activated chloride channel family protein
VIRWFTHLAVGGFLVLLVLSQAGLGGVEWGSPWAFFLAIPVILLPWQRALTGSNALAVPMAGPRRWTLRLMVAETPDVLKLAGLLLMVVAMAKPRLTHKDVIIESEGLDIMLAIDTSGSMNQQDIATGSGYASRIAVAKAVAAEFVAGRPHDRIGLVVFGEEAFTHVPLTLDHDTLIETLTGPTVAIGIAGSRGTAVGTAVAVSSKRMKEVQAEERIVILVTDGRSNAGRLTPLDAARAAKALGIKIYTIGVGAAGGGLMDADGVDEPMMRSVAEETGGQYFRATDKKALEEVYATIDKLQPSPAKVKDLVEHEELYHRALVPSLLLLLIAALLGYTWLRRSP